MITVEWASWVQAICGEVPHWASAISSYDFFDSLGLEIAMSGPDSLAESLTASVDSGLLFVGDPCYVLPCRRVEELNDRFGRSEKSPGLDYDDLLESLGPSLVTQLSHDAGHAGRGVVFRPGGDGSYEVVVEKDGAGRVLRVVIECGE